MCIRDREMGKRKLAYEINYLTEGYYVLVKFTSCLLYTSRCV